MGMTSAVTKCKGQKNDMKVVIILPRIWDQS